MSELFLTVLNMSLTASYVILFVMLVRLLLKKAPKVISYVLWGVVAFRLIIPFSFESMFSLIPRNANAVPIPHDIIYQQTPQINSRIEAVDPFVSQSLPAPTAGASANPFQIYVEIGAYIWVFGIIALLVYSLVSILILKRQLKSAQLIEKNIFQVHNLQTPFVLGLVRPKIYLPVGLSKEEQNYILIHEQTHIHRKDHIIKIIAFLIVSIHWFNPLVWIAFVLMSTDMELSCDERVLKVMDEDIKKPYANTLLSLAAGRHILNGSPLAFGEGNVKRRIKNVLNYKKPRFWLLFTSVVLAVVVGIGLAVNPRSDTKLNGSLYRVKDILYNYPLLSFRYTLDRTPQYIITSDFKLYIKEYNENEWRMLGKLYSYEMSMEDLYKMFIILPSDNVYDVINKTKEIYRADSDGEVKRFYLVMQQKNRDILLAEGYSGNDFNHIRWLFRLEKLSDINDEAVGKNSTNIRWDAATDVPQPVRDYAVDYVCEQIEYYNSLGYNIIDAKITAMTHMNTGTASLTKSIEMWQLEYRLQPENADKVVLAGGMRIEDGWLTEWGSTGQPYLLLLCDYTGLEKSWQRICVTNTDVITKDYGTPEMLEQYGNEFTAAAMELYKKNLK